ncbi:S1C family serine protease [Serinicoccus sp. LYQ131]|uniref:S1C family serine protease n=1 Tax=Serinicoccus sp. LYQ131 TaxID=3378797 RepID=UPI003851BFA5
MSTPHPDPHADRRNGDADDLTAPIHCDDTGPVPGPSATGSTSTAAAPTGAPSTGGTPTGPVTTATPTGPAPSSAPRRPRRRSGDVVVAAVLAAVLASGGTFALTELAAGDGDSPQVIEASGEAQGTTVSLSGEQDWASVAEAVTPSTVSIAVAGAAGQGSGSGVVWDDQGHIVTNAHVVEGAQEVQVSLPDGRTYSADVVGSDVSSDLAVLQLQDGPDDLQAIAVGDDDALGVGDPVMAVGNPLGLSGTVTTGIVSALDRPVSTQSAQGSQQAQAVVTNAIQTSAAINPGNSGGALVNAAGELVGINSSIASLSSGVGGQSGSIGIGFAIPSGKVQLIAEQLIETGTATHAFLGVGLNDAQAEVDGATVTGAVVTQVEAGSPAAGAGLAEGDVIIAIDEEPTTSATALVGQVRERAADEEAVVSYVRDGERTDVTVRLTTRPDEG